MKDGKAVWDWAGAPWLAGRGSAGSPACSHLWSTSACSQSETRAIAAASSALLELICRERACSPAWHTDCLCGSWPKLLVGGQSFERAALGLRLSRRGHQLRLALPGLCRPSLGTSNHSPWSPTSPTRYKAVHGDNSVSSSRIFLAPASRSILTPSAPPAPC